MSGPSRIKEVPQEQMTQEQADVFKNVAAGRGRLPTPYRIWIHSAGVAAGMEKLGTYLNKGSSLTRREIEIAICMTAHAHKGDYVWTNHVKHGVEIGIPREVFDAMQAGRKPTLEDERERIVYDLSVIALGDDFGSDEVYDRAEKVLGRRGIAEVLALLGYYGTVSMGMKIHRVPLLE